MSAGDKEQERRRFTRTDCLKVGRVIIVDNMEELHMKRSVALTKNMSAGGLLFRDAQEHHIGDLVLIGIDAGALDESELEGVIKTHGYVLGRIVRMVMRDVGKAYDYGVSFVTIDDDGTYMRLFQELLNCLEFEEE